MKFYKLIKDILNTLRMEKAEFQRLTGINPVNITWWEQHPDTLPQMKTIKRIEQGLGILFDFDEDGRPTGWQKSDGASAPESSAVHGAHGKENVMLGGAGLKSAANTSLGLVVPGSPAELYEHLEIYGEKKPWDDLTVSEAQFYENLFQVFVVEVDEANSTYERMHDLAAIERAHAIEDAKMKIRRAIVNNLMGEMNVSSELPL